MTKGSLRSIRRALLGCLGVLGCWVLVSPDIAAQPPTDAPSRTAPEAGAAALTTLHHTLDTALAQEPALERGALIVVGRQGVVSQRLIGRTREDTRLPLLGGSAWLTTAAILTLVERGELALEDSLGDRLPEVPADKGAITLRQLLSHTSGLAPQHPCLGDRDTTLAQCAEAILATPLRAPPGREGFFGGTGLQVAGWWAEEVTGRPWAEFFQERLADPLGLECATYGATGNPHLSRGARACVGDVAAFLGFLVQPGATAAGLPGSKPGEDTRTLMFTPQTGSARLVYAPGAETGFGLGTALEPPWVHTPGTFGAPLAVNPETGLGLGLLFTASPQRLMTLAETLRAVLFPTL